MRTSCAGQFQAAAKQGQVQSPATQVQQWCLRSASQYRLSGENEVVMLHTLITLNLPWHERKPAMRMLDSG